MSLELKNLSVGLGPKSFAHLDAMVSPGEVLAVMGPSGSGKSTLLAAITGTLAPEFKVGGEVWLDGRNVINLPAHKRQMGLLFQNPLLFPHMDVAGNVAFGLPAGGDRRVRAVSALADVGLADFAKADPETLSGGQAARVALVRTLVSEPKALLLDEPFSRLDAALRGQVRSLVLERAKNLPVVIVTHDAEDAAAATQVIELGQK